MKQSSSQLTLAGGASISECYYLHSMLIAHLRDVSPLREGELIFSE